MRLLLQSLVSWIFLLHLRYASSFFFNLRLFDDVHFQYSHVHVIIIIIIIIIIAPSENVTPTLAGDFSLESERQQVFSLLQDSFQYSGWS